jgi:hypothetical protein
LDSDPISEIVTEKLWPPPVVVIVEFPAVNFLTVEPLPLSRSATLPGQVPPSVAGAPDDILV